MFRQLAQFLTTNGIIPNPADLFLYHPLQLTHLMEIAWNTRYPPPALAPPINPPPALALPDAVRNPLAAALGVGAPLAGTFVWDHLIYAYMIENTRIYEIFRRVLHEYLHGERLTVPSLAGERWLRNTEDLFYRDVPPFYVFTVRSDIRPNIRASRRNAYFRMFGMDLNHGTDEGQQYPFIKADASNREFATTFEQLLREVWRGIVNITNQVGPRPTDDAAIADLATRLFEMLTARRRNGNLTREEFLFVSTMSWFHLTVEIDSPIVVDLQAQGVDPAERLQKIGQKVGVPSQRRANDFFALAEPMSRILTAIEAGGFNNQANVPILYTQPAAPPPPPPPTPRDDMLTIINSWSIATGRNVKADPVVVNGRAPVGTRV